MDILPIDIEVVNECNLDESERSGFIETEPVQLGEEQTVLGSKIVNLQTEGELIKQLLDGKLSFSDYKCQVLDPDDVASDADDEFVLEEEEEDSSDASEEEESSESHSLKFDTELKNQRRNQLRGQFSKVSSRHRGRPKKSILPPALQGLMGEANLRYARGDVQTAETVCLEIVRQHPLAVEPFHTLAQIYEGKDQEKFMQFMLIAGHLNPSDVDHWIRLAEMYHEAGNLKQAAACYSKAVTAAPHDLELRLRRIELIRQMGDEKYALKLQLYMISYVTDAPLQMRLMKEVAQKYHEMGVPERALIAYRSAHKVNGDHFSMVDVNHYLELLMDAKMYADAVNVLCQHTQIELQVTPKTKGKEHSIDAVILPADLIPDFRTKISVSLIHLKSPWLHEYIIDEALKALHVEDDGDCLLDIAEALMAVESYAEALRLLEPLVESEKFGLAAVFLRYADCLRYLGETDRAVESYRVVVKLAPHHFDARLTLSALLKLQFKHAEALQALEQDLESDVLDPTLLYEHCYMLKETGNIEQYIDLSGVLFSRHCLRFRNRDEAEIAINTRRCLEQRNSIKEYREFRREDTEDAAAPEFVKDSDELEIEREFELLVDVVKQCQKTKRFVTMQVYTHQALTSKRFQKHRMQIQFMALAASVANKDYRFSSFHAKELLLRFPNNSRTWNLYVANQKSTAMITRANRFLMRFMQRMEDVDPQVYIWKSIYAINSGSFHITVRESSEKFNATKDPFAALFCAVALCHLSVQKFSHHKSDHLNQAVLYMLEYGKVREPEAEQEVYYNTGRLYHQLGLILNATVYYKKVLECKTDPDPQVAELIDLKMEAAYNLHLIYKESGNMALAKKILYDYVVI